MRRAVEASSYEIRLRGREDEWRHDQVRVAAPVRIDLGGGWSDTPPFCLDWGGTV